MKYSFYIGNYVSVLFKNGTVNTGEIMDIKPDDHYIILRIYNGTSHNDIKIMEEEINGVKIEKHIC